MAKFRSVCRWLLFLTGSCCLITLLANAPARAQLNYPQPQPLPDKRFMSKSTFYLPVKVDDRVRADLREVRLYVKDDPSRPWILQEKVAPTQSYFTFRAPREGEFWFTVVTVDKMGRAMPSDLRYEKPSVIAVVDVQPPQLEVRPLPCVAEGICVQCLVRDANVDLTRTRFYFQTGDMTWMPLDPLPGQLDRYCIPQEAGFTGMVRVEASDLASNAVRRDFNLGNPALAAGQKPVQENAALKQASFSNPEEVAMVAKPRMMDQVVPSIPRGPRPADMVPQARPTIPREDAATAPVPTEPDLNPTPPAGPRPADMASRLAANQLAPIARDVNASDSLASTSAAQQCEKRSAAAANCQLVSKKHVFLEYQIDNMGPSGVGKVEVWMTRDQGQSWRKHCADADRKSPVEIDLPGEGSYGVSLVVSNGRGFGATPPAPGDAPEWTFEVDQTKPAVEITSVQPASGLDAGCLIISWSAADKNLSAEPIDLYYSSARQGPWRPIARNLKNDGQYRWCPPADLNAEALLRLVARDAAGNTAQVETAQPVTLDDQSRPSGRVTNVGIVAPKGK